MALFSYNEKLFKIIFYELYYSIKNIGKGKSFKEPDIHPCPYYFTHKIAQFINTKKISSVAELGCGFGRVVNFLDRHTKAKIYGYEIDKEAFDTANKYKGQNTIIALQDILKINYNNLDIECFILVDPFYQLTKENLAAQEELINKIEKGKEQLDKKYYIITVNINETRNYIFNKNKLIKLISAGKNRKIKFYSIN